MGINEVVQIGNRIKDYRKSKGFTQKELALRANIPYSTYSNYENNNREPNREQLQKIATALNVPLYELMGFDGSIRVNGNKQRPFDIAIQKFQNKEDLTYEEEDAITEYVESEQFSQEKEDIKQIAQKAYKYISYLHSNSYASSAEELDMLQDAKQIELEKKRAKPFKLCETDEEGLPKPFTRPLQSSYDKQNEDHQDNSLKLHTNTRGIDWEQLDDFRFDELMLKLDRGEELTSAEISFKSAYLERCLKKVGYIFAKFYSMLNVEGQKKADEQIDRAIEQVELLTKIPEYQKKPDEPPQE